MPRSCRPLPGRGRINREHVLHFTGQMLAAHAPCFLTTETAPSGPINASSTYEGSCDVRVDKCLLIMGSDVRLLECFPRWPELPVTRILLPFISSTIGGRRRFDGHLANGLLGCEGCSHPPVPGSSARPPKRPFGPSGSPRRLAFQPRTPCKGSQR